MTIRKSETVTGGAPVKEQEPCNHDWSRAGSIGLCVCYECTKCGEQFEKDVS